VNAKIINSGVHGRPSFTLHALLPTLVIFFPLFLLLHNLVLVRLVDLFQLMQSNSPNTPRIIVARRTTTTEFLLPIPVIVLVHHLA